MKKHFLPFLFFVSLIVLFVSCIIFFSSVNAQIRADSRDALRLNIKDTQEQSYAEFGKYIQVRRDRSYPGGSGLRAIELSQMDFHFEYQIDTYKAKCGDGWILRVYYPYQYDTGTSTVQKVLTRSYGFGCRHDVVTTDW